MGLHRTCKNLVPLVLLAGLSILLQKVNCSCGSDAECSIINVQSTTSEINVTGLAGGFSLQNITFLNNSLVKPAESFINFTLITGLISGTQYVIYYGNSSISCCNTTTTKPKVVKQLSANNVTSNSISLTWDKPDEYNSNYFYRVQSSTPDIIVQNESATINNLTAGQTYTFTVFTRANIVTEGDGVSYTTCTNPLQPGPLNITNIGTKSISVSWEDPINMENLTKNFNITYNSSISSWTVLSNTSNVTLQSLTSGTKYSITVVTVGACQHQSLPVSSEVTTKPNPVKQLRVNNVTSNSISLIWDKPDEHNSNYFYRVQSSTPDIIVQNESATINNLTAGETYTFTVFTRANNVTEGDGVSYTTCTIPGQILTEQINVTNRNSTEFLEVKWLSPAGRVDSYNVTLNGDLQKSIKTNATQVNFTDLLPGRKYSISIEVVSGNCTRTSGPVTEATYPSKPGSLNVSNIETNSISLFWEEPINMTGVAKSFNISYSTSSSILTVASNISNVTLPSLISGTKYTITVVTVGALQYQSLPVSIFVTTKPKPVKNLRTNNLTSESISVIWEKPDEYNSNYTYRVQINNSTSIIVITESTTITNLTSGQLYSISVFTRAYNLTEGESVSITTCIIPGQITSESINVTNKNSSNFLEIKWPLPKANVDYYNVLLNGDPSKTTKINNMNTTQVNFTDLLPGREYSISIQTVSGNCTQTAGPVTEATYPSPPGTLNFTKTETQNITLSWGDPINMANVTKSFNIMYSNSTVTWTVSSNTSSVTLKSLISGTNYAVTVVTVGARQYQSSPVSGNVTTIPESVHLLQCSSVYEKPELSLTWQCPNGSHSIFEITLANGTSVINKNFTSNCISGKQTEIMTYLKYFTKYSVNITTLSFDKRSNVVQITSCETSIARPPEINVSPVQSVKPSNDKINFTFAQFDSSNGPIMAYAVVVSAQTNDAKPPQGILNYTYNDFKNKKSTIYVTYIKESGFRSGISNKANPITVQIGDGSKTHGYSNGPLEASTSYWISIAGFSRIQYDNNTGTIIENSSLATFAPYSKVTTSNAGAIAGSIMGYVLGIFALMMLM